MDRDDATTRRLDRRSMLGLAGATASSLLVAGCGEPGEGGPDGVEDPEDEGQDPDATQDEEEEETDDGGPDEEEVPDEALEDEEDEEDVDEADVEEDDEWAEADEFHFEGTVSQWIGLSPSVIEDEENPTLELYEGREYELVWENSDGVEHNLEVRDEDGETYRATEFNDTEEETDTLEFEATEELAVYACGNHEDEMVGEIEIRSG